MPEQIDIQKVVLIVAVKLTDTLSKQLFILFSL